MDSKSSYNIYKIPNRSSYEGNPMQIFEVEGKDESYLSRKEMIKMVNEKFLKSFRDKYVDGLISITIKHEARWFSGEVSWLHDDANFFSADDYDEYDSDPNEYTAFRVSFLPMNHAHDAGGKDEHNDCLINCIKKFFFDNNTRWFFQPETLKETLKIERDDPINIAQMGEVEAYMNSVISHEHKVEPYAIHVSGDAQYISPIKTNKIIRLVLTNGHYTLDQKVCRIRDRSFDERTIMMFEYTEDGINTFDGENETVISQQDYDTFKSVKSGVLLVNANIFKKSGYIKKLKIKNIGIVDLYHYYIELADEMKKESDGKFNFYKTGSFKQMALNYFYDITKAIQPEDISTTEAEWIDNASYSALTHWEPFKGHVKAYDVNSLYPYVMHKNQHYFPIKAGEFSIIDSLAQKPLFGIYRVKISKLDGKPYKMFQFNKLNYYTNLAIETALVYGLKVELIMDGKPNALIYSKDKVTNGAFLFQKYVKEIYELKQRKVKGSKDLLSVLWGALSESKLYEYYDKEDQDTNIIEASIVKMHAGDNISIKVRHTKQPFFKTNWARVKPFILAYARVKMFYCFRSFEDDIVRMHTDSIYLKKGNNLIKTGDTIGHLKIEYVGNVDIKGLNTLNKS
jgi:hypothetical protein